MSSCIARLRSLHTLPWSCTSGACRDDHHRLLAHCAHREDEAPTESSQTVGLRLAGKRLSVSAVYHVFDAERTALDYGSEIDLQVQAAWRRFNGLLKYSDYREDGFASDTRKVWLQVDFVL